MRIRIAVLVSSCVTLAAPSAWAQAPGQLPPGAPPGPPSMVPGPGMLPQPQAYPPPVWSPPGPPQPPTFAPPAPMPPPAPLPPASPPPEAPQLQLAHRVGFGIGFYFAPGGNYSGSAALGALSSIPAFGGALGIRWWVKERLALLPSLNLGVSHSTIPNLTTSYGGYLQGGSFTSGTVAPALSLGYAVYRGKSTRFVITGGAGFNYTAQQTIKDIPTAGGSGSSSVSRYITSKSLSFDVPFGFALEQFFTSRISVTVGAQAPLFEYRSTKLDVADATTSVGSNFSASQLNAAIYFYTD